MLDLSTDIAIISTVFAAIQTYFAVVQTVRLRNVKKILLAAEKAQQMQKSLWLMIGLSICLILRSRM